MLRKIACILLLCTSLIGCSSGGGEEKTSTNSSTSSNKEETKEEEEEVDYDPFGAYEEPPTVTAVLSVTPLSPGTKEGTTPENNLFVNAIRDELNIDFQWLWTVPYQQYAQKFGVAMASQQLPDIITASNYDYQTLLENDQIQPWNEALKYASDELKARIYQDKTALDTVTDEDGNLMALPRYWEPERTLEIMYIRKDWLDEFGLEVPTTVEELEHVAQTFVDKKGIKAGISFAERGFHTFMGMFGVYLDKWVEDENGNLVVGEGTPEAKDALEVLNRWYESGIINKEYALTDFNTDIKEWILQEELGILVAPFGGASHYVGYEYQKNKGSFDKWVTAPIPKKEGTKGAVIDKVLFDGNGSSGYLLINKDCENPEAIVKMLNLYVKMHGGQEKLGDSWAWNLAPILYYRPDDFSNTYNIINAEIEKGNLTEPPKGLNYADTVMFEQLTEYEKWKNGEREFPDDVSFHNILTKVDKDFAWGTIMEVMDSGEYAVNQFYGPPTPLMKERKPTLDKLRDEVFNKIVMGETPLDAFDKYLEDWNKMGGEDMVKEVNEWYLENK